MRRMSAFPAAPAQLDLFVSQGGDIAARDAQDLMAWPFFSLAKTKRVRPIDFRMGEVSILVEATAEHGMATIWDADVLIWVASQIVEARDAGRPTSRLASSPNWARPGSPSSVTRSIGPMTSSGGGSPTMPMRRKSSITAG